eukprot:sb/3478043/
MDFNRIVSHSVKSRLTIQEVICRINSHEEVWYIAGFAWPCLTLSYKCKEGGENAGFGSIAARPRSHSGFHVAKYRLVLPFPHNSILLTFFPCLGQCPKGIDPG